MNLSGKNGDSEYPEMLGCENNKEGKEFFCRNTN